MSPHVNLAWFPQWFAKVCLVSRAFREQLFYVKFWVRIELLVAGAQLPQDGALATQPGVQ